jgi:ribulose-bisphosphate carboxylase large chain
MAEKDKKIEWYHEFINTNYKPKSNDIKVLFHYEPAKGISSEDAIGRVASESSSGTWTTLTELPKLLPKVKAYAYKYNSNLVKIAYPLIDFESSSVPQLMSSIAGNIFGMKAVENLRLLDAALPEDYIKNFHGPLFGKDVIQKIFKRKSGPVTSVVPKPKIGFTSREHAEKVGYPIWKGGIDCIKDDENLTNQVFNKFEDRIKWLAKFRDKAEKETGDIKDAFINVTAPNLKELERRIKFVHDNGFRYFMIDVFVAGFGEVGTAVESARDYKMAIHAHRAMHAAMTKNKHHGIEYLFFAKLLRLLGVDQLHTGTVVGKLEGDPKEISAMNEMLTKQRVDEIKGLRMPQKWNHIKPVLPVSSGGLHPGILNQVFDIYKTTDIGLQVGGGTQGHPNGIESGARAVLQAIDAYKQGISVQEYAKSHKELRTALEKWGTMKPM